MRPVITDDITKFAQEVELEMMEQMAAKAIEMLDVPARDYCEMLEFVFSGYLQSKEIGDTSPKQIDKDLYLLNRIRNLLIENEAIHTEAKLRDVEKKFQKAA